MRFHEIFETASVGASSAGGIAPISQPLGELQKRVIDPKKNKYRNAAPKLGIGKDKHAER